MLWLVKLYSGSLKTDLLKSSGVIAAVYCVVRVIKSRITRLVGRVEHMGKIRKSRRIFVWKRLVNDILGDLRVDSKLILKSAFSEPFPKKTMWRIPRNHRGQNSSTRWREGNGRWRNWTRVWNNWRYSLYFCHWKCVENNVRPLVSSGTFNTSLQFIFCWFHHIVKIQFRLMQLCAYYAYTFHRNLCACLASTGNTRPLMRVICLRGCFVSNTAYRICWKPILPLLYVHILFLVFL